MSHDEAVTSATGSILIAEDSRTQAEYLRLMLEDAGFSSTVAAAGQKALEAMAESRPILVISDIVMPRLDGFGLCRAIRLDPALSDIPVILLTSLAGREDILKGLDVDADGFVCKPYEPHQLFAAMESAMARRADSARPVGRTTINHEGQRYDVPRDPERVLDVLLGVYGQAIDLNRQLAQRQEQLSRANRAIAWLGDLARRLGDCNSEQDIITCISEEAIRLHGARSAWLVLHDESGGVVIRGKEDIGDGSRRSHCSCLELAGERSGSDLVMVATCDLDDRESAHLTVPIRIGTIIVGALNIAGLTPEHLSDEERRVVTSAGGRIGAALDRARLLESLESKVRERTAQQAALADLGLLAVGEASKERIATEAARLLATLPHAEFAAVLELDARSGDMHLIGEAGRLATGEHVRVAVGTSGLLDHTLSQAAPVVARELGNDSRLGACPWLKGMGLASAALVPMVAAGGRLGVVLVASSLLSRFGDPDVALLTSVASVLAASIERGRTYLALQESIERYNRAERGSSTIFYEWDVAGDSLYFSPRFVELLGYEPGEVAARRSGYASLVHPDDHERVRKATDQHISGDARYAVEYRVRKKDGSYLWFYDMGEAVRDAAGRALLMAGSLNDITSLRIAEQQLAQTQKMEAIGNLTGGIAHDFNNMLTIVMGNLDLALLTIGDQPQIVKLIGSALHASQRGADLTRQLLAFARKQTLQPAVINLDDQIARIAGLLERSLGETISISVARSTELWPVSVDPAQFESALANLAVNARDAMPRGGDLTFETTMVTLDESYAEQGPEMQPGDYVCVAVSDTGGGMDAETQRRIFEPFFTTKPEGKGTGLGLAMVFGFMKQSHGHIAVYSELGKGTTFRLYFPRHDGPLVDLEAEEAPASLPKGRTLRILVIEDNPQVARAVIGQLEEAGCVTVHVDNALAALEELEGGARFDLLFTDTVMPGGLDGIQLATEVQERWPDMRVLLTSGFADAAMQSHGELPKGLRFLAKPYRRADLLRVVSDVIAS